MFNHNLFNIIVYLSKYLYIDFHTIIVIVVKKTRLVEVKNMENKKYDWNLKEVAKTSEGVNITFEDDKTLFVSDILLKEIQEKYGEKVFSDKEYYQTNMFFSDLIIKDRFRVSKGGAL